MPLPELSLFTLALAAATVTLAYAVYGLSGFGANMVAVPVLAHLLSLRMVVPMLVLFDLITGVVLLRRQHPHVAWREVLRLAPWLVIGMVAGVTLLAQVSERILLVGLGGFVLAFSLWSLLRRVDARPIATGWAVPAGLVGGTVTALYGTGGPIYTIYLARRLPDKSVLRATIAGLIMGNSVVRLALFAGTGFYHQSGLLSTALLLLPCALLGQHLGARLHHRLSKKLMR